MPAWNRVLAWARLRGAAPAVAEDDTRVGKRRRSAGHADCDSANDYPSLCLGAVSSHLSPVQAGLFLWKPAWSGVPALGTPLPRSRRPGRHPATAATDMDGGGIARQS